MLDLRFCCQREVLQASDDAKHMQVISEIEGGLENWKQAGRWEERGIVEQVAQKDFRWSY